MKLFIAQFIFFSLFYYMFESIFNRVTIGSIIEDHLQKPKMGLWGFTSIWMLPFGGVVSVVIGFFTLIPFFDNINSIPLLMLMGGTVITLTELGGGYLLNIKMKLNIWDYDKYKFGKIKIGRKNIKLNLWGQIDVVHSIGWCFITLPIFYFSKIIEWLVK